MTQIVRNRIKCRSCGDIIESTHRHDFKWCSCRKVAVDGGLDYPKRLFPSEPMEDHLEDLTEYAPEERGDT